MRQASAAVLSYVPVVLAEIASASSRPPPWGDIVDGTLVMADVSGFTTLSERLAQAGLEGAEQLTGIINRFFGRHLDLAREYGGDTLTFGGDAILLLFRHEGHADRAVAASCRMLTETERMPSIELTGGRVKLGMSVGAHSGTFLLVAAGTPEERMQLFVVGNAGARAAAAEAHAGRGELVLSGETAGSLLRPWQLEADGDWVKVSVARGKGWAPSAILEVKRQGSPSLSLLSFAPPYLREAFEAGRTPGLIMPEHRRVSVVFIGVEGLNLLLEADGPEAAMAELQGYISGVVSLATKHHGFLVSTDIDTRGFKLILTFGAPSAHEFAAANAARFVLGLKGLAGSGSGRLTQFIGVNGGHVFAGDVGPPWRRQYTVMGDAVNLAARLMTSADSGAILAERSWAEQAGAGFCVGERSPIRVKGKAQAVSICVLEEERQPEAGTSRWTTRFFGREKELELFARLWIEVDHGAGKLLVIQGEPGVGKSRFIDEALRQEALDSRVLRTSCHEHLRGIPLVPWVEPLSQILGVSREQSVTTRTSTTAAALERLAPAMTEFASLLNPVLGLNFPTGHVVGSLDVHARRERFIELVGRLIMTRRPARSHVLVIEDIHWADDSSLALLSHLAENVGSNHLLIIASTRAPEDPVIFGSSASFISLSELSRTESIGLIRSSLGVPDLPEAVADAVHQKTRGNPLFLEEVVHSLAAPGVLDRILGASSLALAAELAALAIPDRVQGLLMSRLDSLPPDEREVLKVAAVVGREFEHSVLEGLPSLPVDPSRLGAVLDNLDRAALVLSTSSNDGEEAALSGSGARRGGLTGAVGASCTARSGLFRFRHALLQEVVYETLPYAQRRQVHGEVAAFIEAGRERPDRGLLVHHYRQAGNKERLRVNAALAASSSRDVYAFREAIDYYDIALDTVGARGAPQRCLRSRFEELSGDCLESLARHEEAMQRYVSARRHWASPSVRAAAPLALAEVAAIPDPQERASDLCRKIAVCLERQHRDYRRALRWLDKATEALPSGKTALASRLQVMRGVIHFRLGRFDESLAYGECGLALARGYADDDALQAYALAMLVTPLVGLGLLQRAIEACLEAITLYESVGDLAGQASGHGNLAACYQLVGNLKASLVHHGISLELNQRLSYHTGVSIIHNNMAEVLLQLGQTSLAIDHLHQVVDGWEEKKMPPALVGFAFVNLSKALLRGRDIAGAQEVLEEGRLLLVKAQARGLLIEAELQAAQLLLSEGRFDEARASCQEVIRAAREAGAKVSQAHGLSLLGRLELTCRNLEAAEEHLNSSIRLSEEIGADYERGLALLTLSELYMLDSAGEGERHAEPLVQAIALLEGMGAEHDLKRACELRDRCSSLGPNPLG